MQTVDSTDKNHPINVFKSIGKYDPETGFIPYVEGFERVPSDSQELITSKSAGCGSCGGGKVR